MAYGFSDVAPPAERRGFLFLGYVLKTKHMLYKEANTLVAENFTDEYFHLHDYLYHEGANVASRNGNTKEILNFKTTLTKPLNRCVGGYKRNINIFFLLAEALWIFTGRRDLKFLEIFNSGMREFSDDGIYFHAPYGWRIRNWSADSMKENPVPRIYDKDQMVGAIRMLAANPEDRRVVISIWNPEFDLGKQSKDLPCNDLLMFKIRSGVLHQTIQNRSNDLNLGLPTNVFQFSFIGEVMAALLGVEYGSQTHNSQSLHMYMNHAMTSALQTEIMCNGYEAFKSRKLQNQFHLYSNATALKLKFNFTSGIVVQKLGEIDGWMNHIIHTLICNNVRETADIMLDTRCQHFSEELYFIYQLLKIYVDYKLHQDHSAAIKQLVLCCSEKQGRCEFDVSLLALNFFFKRLADKSPEKHAEMLGEIHHIFPNTKNIPLGKL